MIAATTDDEEAGRTHPTGWLNVIQPEQPGEDHDAHVGAYADHLRGLFQRGRFFKPCSDVLVRWRRGTWRWRSLDKPYGADLKEPPLAAEIRRLERAFQAEVNKAVRVGRLVGEATPRAAQARREQGDETRACVWRWAALPECQRAANGKPIPKRIAAKVGISAARVRAILAEGKTLASETE